MIRVENIEVDGWKAAIRGMRNPLNSWKRSDTSFNSNEEFCIGPEDFRLMKNLVKAGSDHSKFMRMINFSCDITAPLYWIKEMDTYKVGTVRNSCSTMHKIQEKEFCLSDFSTEHLYTNENSSTSYESPLQLMSNLCACLNYYRERFLYTKDKADWWQLIQLLPSSYN